MFGLKLSPSIWGAAQGGGAGLPSGALGLWYFDQYTTSTRPQVPNSMIASAANASLLPGPRRVFANAGYWAGNAGTFTDSGQTGPDGLSDASTYVAAGDFFCEPVTQPTLAAGPYLLALSAKRNTGSDQQFKMSNFTDGSTSATKTATSAWQRFTHTFTVASPGAKRLFPMISFDRATGVNVQIQDVELFAGSVDLGPGAVASHLVLAGDPASPPTYASGTLDFSSSKYGIIQFPTGTVALTSFTSVALVSKVASGGSHQAVLSKIQSFSQFSAYLEESGLKSGRFGGVTFAEASVGLWALLSDNYHIITSRVSGSTFSIFLDDVLIFTGTIAPTTPVTADDLQIGRVSTVVPTNYKVGALALYGRALTNAEVRSVVTVFRARAVVNGLTIPTLRIYVAEGDSITAGNGVTPYPYLFGPNASPKVYGISYAVAGTGLTDAIARAPNVDAAIPAVVGGRTLIFSSNIGGNGMPGDGTPELTQFIADLAAYLDARRAAGFKVVATTFLPRTTAGFNAARNTVNTSIRTWVGVHCDAIADFAADTTMGIDGNGSTTGPWNTTYYSDGTHPTATGQALLETIIRPVINAL